LITFAPGATLALAGTFCVLTTVVLARPSHFPKKHADPSPHFRDISVPMRVVFPKPVW
jgi:hypothetical protein